MNCSQNSVWEIGSEFHWLDFPEGPYISFPQNCNFLALARDAIVSIWNSEKKRHKNVKLFVPSYFCYEVIDYWNSVGIDVREYVDYPLRENPEWDTIECSPGDMILAVNYFGVRDGKGWRSWHENKKKVILIEDHTHDPFSEWALKSSADYSFASLRKTMPITDGAILWSPLGHPLPDEPHNIDWRGSSLKLASMIFKKEYLFKGDEKIKEAFRSFQIEGDNLLSNTPELSITPWSKYQLSRGYPAKWRQKRERNVKLFWELFCKDSSCKPLFENWPTNHCPFNAILLLSSQEKRDQLHSRLIKKNIYTSIHWTLKSSFCTEALDMSRKILTVPVDQRYSEDDIEQLAYIMMKELH